MKQVYAVEFKPGTQEELLPDYDESFPCIASDVVFTDGYYAPWHWHKAVELFYIKEGTLEYMTPSQSHVFHAGSGGLINSNVLHKAIGGGGKGRNYLHLFDPILISGHPGSVMETKYVLPLTTASHLEMIVLEPETHGEILQKLEQTFAMPGDMPGYELHLRNALSEIWLAVLDTLPLPKTTEDLRLPSELVKQMLVYIHEHYGEKLTVRKIGEAASVSERTCFDLFRKNLRTTPMEYVNSYRLRMACQMLGQTSKSVTAISDACGMNNSYFSQLFRESTGFTPLEYRRFYLRHQSSLRTDHPMEAQQKGMVE